MKDPNDAFQRLSHWIHDDIIVARKAPGLIVGLSGTDSLVAFLAAYDALTKTGKPHRLWGVHFAPSEEFLDYHPEAEAHTWFGDQVVPWVVERCRDARVLIDTSIDWRMDGVRWGMLAEMGTVSYKPSRRMRAPEDQFWLMGTRNRTEDLLYTYSNASMACSIQPLVRLWKSEVLQIAVALGVPEIAVKKSCEVDCICGRDRLPAHHVREVDLLLAAREGEQTGVEVEPHLRLHLESYINQQVARGHYKRAIPYQPEEMP